MNNIKFNGNKLTQIRREKNISQEKLADLIGVTRQTIYLWESNQNLPDVEKFSKICEVLNVTLSDLVDGMSEQNNTTPKKDSSNSSKKMNKKEIIKIVSIILLIAVIIYLLISFNKFLKIKDILNKWENLNKADSYYINYCKVDTNKNGVFTKDDICYEKYMNNKVVTTVFKDTETNEKNSILIDNFNTKERVITDEKDKTYRKEILKLKSPELIDNIPSTLKIDNSNYIICFSPKFNIRKNGDYIIKIDSLTTYINRNTGLVYYEEYYDRNPKAQNFIKEFKIEINTNKKFEVNLDDYTEVE